MLSTPANEKTALIKTDQNPRKIAPRARSNIFNERTRVLPISEPDPLDPVNTPQIDDETQNDETDDQENLDDGKEELDLAIDPDERESNEEGEEDEDDDEDGGVEVGPKLEEDADSGYFGWDLRQSASGATWDGGPSGHFEASEDSIALQKREKDRIGGIGEASHGFPFTDTARRQLWAPDLKKRKCTG